MNKTKIKESLEVATNVAVILVAVVLLSMLARVFFNDPPNVEMRAGLQKGQKLDNLLKGMNGNKNQTLVVALSTTCHYCEESIPFYNRLTEIQHETNSPVAIFAVFPNSEIEVREYVRRAGLNISTTAETNFKALNLVGTPTMILLDSSGVVQNFWVGKLSKDQEQEVIAAMGLKRA